MSQLDPGTDDLAEKFGLNERQKRLADALLAGATQVEAARAAGYSQGATEAAARSSASNRCNSPKVRRYMQAAQATPLPEIPDDLLVTIAAVVTLLQKHLASGPISRRLKHVA
ncbi:hypothetical protein [Hyphomicrobium sp. D-2]|uniref:hypothetical protein n=1 Tax=Hyphomicrobium sp. D-2 TaxID=3041621 RepID=UPI002455E0EE|nr:hypothetical protein [Hyphomicrobium sp. D-2]MDH4983259.1 hypothetical protein [Hyphomicrobium sp. D-2]